jgi:hypothetical protein
MKACLGFGIECFGIENRRGGVIMLGKFVKPRLYANAARGVSICDAGRFSGIAELRKTVWSTYD